MPEGRIHPLDIYNTLSEASDAEFPAIIAGMTEEDEERTVETEPRYQSARFPSLNWEKITSDPRWDKLDPEKRAKARNLYYQDAVLTSVPVQSLGRNDIDQLKYDFQFKTNDSMGDPLRRGLMGLANFPADVMKIASETDKLLKRPLIVEDEKPDAVNLPFSRKVGEERNLFSEIWDAANEKINRRRLTPEEIKARDIKLDAEPDYYKAVADHYEAFTEDIFKPKPATGEYAKGIDELSDLLSPGLVYQAVAEGGPLLISFIKDNIY